MPASTSDDATRRPHPRWDPGARYRPSALAGLPSPRPAALVPGTAQATTPRGASSADASAPRLTGRLRRGPAARTAVFDRDLWRPVQHVTTGLVRVVGRALGR
ncbi:hypothetical protein ACH436_03805 [Isoptericola sp. NPDC019693]|uniref:hypothetical protein n=1 Tax=Isoptericola sp. NPDC019693 TaxID=3364009 RepID=UPI003788CE38